MDKNEMEKLYQQHFSRVYRTAFFITGDPRTAEDVAQEAFLKAFANLPMLKDRRKFGPWINVIASNYAVDLLRKGKKIFLSDDMEIYGGEAHEDNPAGCWEKEEDTREIRSALARLGPEDREILVLKYYQELSIKEIADLLGAPAGTIKSRLFRARDKMRLLLQPGGRDIRPVHKGSLPL